MQEAVLAKEKAQAAEQTHLEQVKALKSQQADIAETVRKEAEAQRDALLADAQKRLDQERADWAAHLDDEKHKYTVKLQRAGGGALLSLTRKALTDLADASLEGRIAEHLATRIDPMADDLRTAAGKSTAAVVTTREALPKTAEADLISSLHTVFPDVSVQFETDAEQSPGLVLRIGGAQLDWTVDGYIDSLAEMMDEQLAAGADLKVGQT
jgi:F-type H+-transporting ATPase subunit b